MATDFNTREHSSNNERDIRKYFYNLFKDSPIPENELLSNLGRYTSRQTLSRQLFMHELYKKIINVHGVVMEFGVRWGQNLALFENFRGIYEPYNYNRKIIGFDTFEGFPSVTSLDKGLRKGDYSVTDDYEVYLEKVLDYHEAESPISHIRKYELIKGDATVTLKNYLEDNPHTIIALAYFDFDIYEPTKECLKLIKDHITKGTIIGFDELNVSDFPGETIALKEILGLSSYRIQRLPISPLQSYIEII
ncbi:MAG TPA: crotonobetainyl-CoA--carnitine CoA-transferase [Clostridium sp.]|nr:crotonobetainyl-CoA--carnitine CoA-transferase [Clostridium sp. Bc-iso-3]HHV28941.1 crotonobetainyl-CoA--carnitine CoA-transferase [Clostridium sp.]